MYSTGYTRNVCIRDALHDNEQHHGQTDGEVKSNQTQVKYKIQQGHIHR